MEQIDRLTGEFYGFSEGSVISGRDERIMKQAKLPITYLQATPDHWTHHEG